MMMTIHCSGTPQSVNVACWSADNRIVYCTGQSIVVLTLQSTSAPSGSQSRLNTNQIVIPLSAGNQNGTATGEDDADDTAAENEDQFKTVCWSPASSSFHGGCLLMALTTRGSLKIYSAISNTRSGSYHEVFAIPVATDPQQPTISAANWSDMCGKECSFVAVGSSKGQLGFYRFLPYRTLQTTPLSTSHQSLAAISRLKWSGWMNGYAYLASGTADGEVMLWELEAIAGQLSLKRQHTLLAADGRCVTVIEWHKIGDRFQLAVGKLGAIHIVRTALPSTTGSSLQQEEVCRIPGSMVPVSVTWSADGNRFTTLTADGRCRVFVKSAGLMNRFEFDERASRKFIDQFQQIPRPFLNRSSSSSSSSSVHDRSSESISRLSADKITLLNNTYGVYLYGAASSFNGLCTAVVYKPYHKTDFGYSTDKSDVTLCDLQFANTGGDLTELNYPQLSNLLLDSSDSLVAGSEQLKRLIKSICDADDRLEAGSTRRMHSLHAINYLLSNCCQADLPPDISIESIGQLTSRNHLISLMESWLVMESGKQLAVDSEQYKCKVISLLNAVHIVLLTMTGDLEAMQMANQCITQLVEQITSPDGELIVPFTNPSLSLSDILSLSQAVQSALEIAGYKSSPRLSQLLNGPQDAVKASVFPEMIVRRGWELCPVCDSDLAITSSNDFGLCEGRLIENGVKLIRHKIERCSLTLLAIDDYWLRGSCNGCGAVAQLPPIDSVQFSIETANACCDNIPFPNCTRCGGRFSHSDL